MDVEEITEELAELQVGEDEAKKFEEIERARSLAAEFGLEYVDVFDFRIQNDLFRRVPFDLMLRLTKQAIARVEGWLDKQAAAAAAAG